VRVGQFLYMTLLAAATCLVAAAAFAQAAAGTPPPSLADTLAGDAKEDYEVGRRLYESGDYSGALAKFQSAYRVSGDPRLLWNAAVCERAMQHYARAVALVRRYLDSHSPLIEPLAERAARDFLAAAETRTAHLDVQASEPGAMVGVDGEPQGAVPLAADLRIDLGPHRVTVTKEGFAEYATTLTVVTSAEVHLTAVLTPIASPEGGLIVRAGSGDTIAVDGSAVGLGTWTGTLPIGSHTVRVTEPESSPFETEVVVEQHRIRSIEVSLRPVRRAVALPVWAWIAGGAVLAAGAVTAGYFVFKTSETTTAAPTILGSIDTVRVP
jgi:hypothetical protein